MLKEFREFIARGNVIDLAVGIIVGAAFTAIVNSFVKDLVNPLIGTVGKANFDGWYVVLKEGTAPSPYATLEAATKAGAVTLNYGAFLTNLINFVIVSFVVFLIVKAVNKAKKPAPVEEAPAPTPSAEEQLLTEIRDLLKAKA